MESLIVGLLIYVLISQVLVLLSLAGVAYLCYKTLIRPEAPCYAAMPLLPRVGTMEIDPNHPAYSTISKMITKKSGETKTDPNSGNYL